MPAFTIPLHEYNHCHDPATGEFCTQPFLATDVARAKAAGYDIAVEPGRLGGSYGRRKITLRSEPTDQRDQVLSVLRHERGHADVVANAVDRKRLDRYPVTFDQPPAGTRRAVYHNSVFLDEYLAWKHAIQQSKTLRVDWPTLTAGLTSHAKNEGVSEKTLALAIRTLKRYARFGRRVRRSK